MKKNSIAYSISLFALLISTNNNTTQLVIGDTTAPAGQTFAQAIVQKVYDRASATMYVGLTASENKKSIWKASRPIGTATPTFTEVIASGLIYDLTLATNLGNVQPYIAYTNSSDNTLPTTVNACTYNGQLSHSTDKLKDATGADTSNIVALAGMLQPDSTTQGFIFAAVAPYYDPNTTNTAYFGDPNSGIAVVSLTNDPNATTLLLNQTAAESTMPATIAAKRLDPTTPQIKIGTDVHQIYNFATMHWDGKLQRLYIGLRLTASIDNDSGAKAVVVAHVSENGVLTLENILDQNALTNDATNAIVARKSHISIDPEPVSILHIRTMHCSTGPSYLIVNGGVDISDNVNNLIYALPLVETCPESAIQGTIADKNSALSYNHTFVVPATTPAGLPVSINADVQVGAGPLPIQPTTPVSDIEVIGDTVFVSTATGQGPTDDNGIFYSQALFEKTGKIARWTPWTKRAFPFNGFCTTPCVNKGVAFFSVDAVTGKVWAVDGDTQKVVRVTAWDKGGTCTTQDPICGSSNSACNSCNSCGSHCSSCQSPYIPVTPCCTLAAQVCASLPCGCYCVLDLDQSTNGFNMQSSNVLTLNRFALFGGCGKVDMALVSTATNNTITSPQTVTEDFCPSCSTNNFVETFLPDRDVCVNVLEYSRTTSADQAYFFAGTDNGLYVYKIDNFNFPALAQGSWSKRTTFPDPIIDIKTTGLSLYIVTRAVKNRTMISTLYRINFKDTVDEMFTDTNNIYILAQSGVDIFAHAPAFTGIQPVAVRTNGNTIAAEQLLLATNDGLFGSNTDSANPYYGIADAEDQTAANWQRVPSNGNQTWFEGIAGIDTPLPSTVWPISVEDLCGNKSFEHSWIYQISSSTTDRTPQTPFFGTFQPTFFNAIVQSPAFELIDPITYFWSDGARRFFIINRQQDPETYNKLMSFPFNTPEWRVCAPGQQVLIFDPYVTATQRFFWVKQIGITGILMAGTNDGVIALE